MVKNIYAIFITVFFIVACIFWIRSCGTTTDNERLIKCLRLQLADSERINSDNIRVVESDIKQLEKLGRNNNDLKSEVGRLSAANQIIKEESRRIADEAANIKQELYKIEDYNRQLREIIEQIKTEYGDCLYSGWNDPGG